MCARQAGLSMYVYTCISCVYHVCVWVRVDGKGAGVDRLGKGGGHDGC